ncbi:hypothetical protein QBC35DRAFT_76336 [Podospora australis]|uniref:Uncharacterized protein n=1 Tax=Podospora australis TaxID=1536484 RepID=A0AAN7ACX3_9PEZI|nr:hypothetical protein QBC35DRAFT_76336 [Podospora australis]
MAFPNVYTHRKVAETAAKSCEICFRLSSSVLITSDNKDWFYVCPSHLKDKQFCTPKIDQEAIEARRKKELQEEIERVKKEYEEKQRKKAEKSKDKDAKDEKEKEGDKGKDKDGEAKDKKDGDGEGKGKGKDDGEEKGKDGDGEENKKEKGAGAAGGEEPRVFELRATFYQQRVNKKRQAEIAKRNRERLRDPNYFPSVPKDLP